VYYVVSFNNDVLGVLAIVIFLFSLNDLHFSHDEANKHLVVNFLSLGRHVIAKVFYFVFER
jgi:hypothetical protein